MDDYKYRILLVDDEKDILDFLSYNLIQNGYKVFTASDGQEAIKKTVEEKPDLIFLDIMLPKMDGVEACNEIRKLPGTDQTIIAFLTARGEDYSQIAGFEAGGDDYIVKPIKPKVLLKRITALLKRTGKSSKENSSTKKIQEILLDKERYLVIKKGKELILPKKEFEILALLMSKPGKVFSREEIFSKIWGFDVIVGDRTLDVHIHKLRDKLGSKYIKTVKGIGYNFPVN